MGKKRLLIYTSRTGATAAFVSTCPSVEVVFLPLKAENTAAKKHRIAANMKAVVSAVMNGVAMAFGKKVWLVRVFNVL